MDKIGANPGVSSDFETRKNISFFLSDPPSGYVKAAAVPKEISQSGPNQFLQRVNCFSVHACHILRAERKSLFFFRIDSPQRRDFNFP